VELSRRGFLRGLVVGAVTAAVGPAIKLALPQHVAAVAPASVAATVSNPAVERALGELLKRVYSMHSISMLQNLQTPLLGRALDKGPARVGGAGFYFPVRVERAEFGVIEES
jgi:hypothetical protein